MVIDLRNMSFAGSVVLVGLTSACSGPGEYCSRAADCIGGSECVNGACRSPSPSTADSGVGDGAIWSTGLAYDVVETSTVGCAEAKGKLAFEPRASMAVPRQEPAVIGAEGQAYVIGGWRRALAGQGLTTETYDVVERYDPTSDTWSTVAPLPTARHAPAVGVLGRELHVIGGWSGEYGYVAAHEVLDLSTGQWRSLPQPPMLDGQPRSGAGGVIDGRFYLWDSEAAWAWDPETGTWSSAPPPPSRLGAGVIIGDLAYAAGILGPTGHGHAWFADFDPKRGYWVQRDFLPSSFEHAVVFGELGQLGGAPVHVGGTEFYEVLKNVVLRYDPVRKTWGEAGRLRQGRYSMGVANLDGLLYVVGGVVADPERHPEVTATMEVSCGMR